MYYSAIGLIAILVLLIVNQDILFCRGKSGDIPAWKVYRGFLYAVMAYYLTDILWGVFESRKLRIPLFADTTVYFAAMAAGVLLWAEFTVAYLEEKNSFGQFLIIAGRVIAGLIALLALINLFEPILFTVDSNCVYRALAARYVILAFQILLLLMIFVYAFSSMKRSDAADGKSPRYRALGLFSLIMAVFLVLQLFFPSLPFYSIAYLLGTCMLHSLIVSDENEEYRRELEEAEKVTQLKETITSLLDNMPGMTFTKDSSTGVYLACNQAFAEYANKENPAGVIGLTDAQIFDAETAAHFVHDDKIALSLSTPYIFVEDVPDAAGNQRQIRTTKLKYRDASGRMCILGMCQDITDLVQIQHENAMTKETYENAVSSSLMYTHIAHALARDYADMFYVNCDTEEYIEYRKGEKSNPLSETRRGWHFFSDGRMELSERVYPDDREAFLEAMKRIPLMKALSRNNTFIMTYRQMEKDGPVYVRMKVSRMEDDEHFIIVGITNVDAQMRETMAKSEALSEALKAAEQANKAKTSFLSSMSHEIRTPMNAIIGLDTLALKKEDLDLETREYLEKIGGSARHLLALINDILDMSRIESGRVILRREVFSFRAMLEQINTMVTSQCGDKGLTYSCSTLSQVDDLYIGDDMKLKEVLINILSNAIKFTDAPGSVTMTVERTRKDEDQSTICFCIKDTGIGMDPEFIPWIFEPFAQEDSRQKNKYGSSGLGMAITKRIVDLMNGSIHVSSEKGVGTEFAVTVSLRNCDQADAVQEGSIDLHALYILVVDDDPIDAEHTRTVLSEAGIRTDTASSGEEALHMMEVQYAKHKPYNLVLMDWNMPGMNGLEASAEIRSHYENESTVVVMTAYNWDDIQEDAKRVGVNSFLAKPLFAGIVIGQLEQIARRNNMKLFRKKKQAPLAGRRILLAEDTQINAEIMMDTLEIENISADHAENGRIAVEMFNNSVAGTYAAILMDVRMPQMNGLEAAKMIRSLPRKDAKRIPIIALTANAFDEDVQLSVQAGMNAHLSKPVDADHLIRVLGELVYEAEEASYGCG